MIDEQRTMKSKIEEQNKELPELIKWIRQLDYCIPGPNPDWEITAGEALRNYQESVPPFETFLGKKGKEVANIGEAALTGASIGAGVGATVGSVVPALGTAIGAAIGAGVGATIGAGWAAVKNWKKLSGKDIRK